MDIKEFGVYAEGRKFEEKGNDDSATSSDVRVNRRRDLTYEVESARAEAAIKRARSYGNMSVQPTPIDIKDAPGYLVPILIAAVAAYVIITAYRYSQKDYDHGDEMYLFRWLDIIIAFVICYFIAKKLLKLAEG